MSRRVLAALLALAFLAADLPALVSPGKAKSKVDVVGSLVRPVSPVDGDARGKMRFRSKSKKDVSVARVDVLVRKVDVSLQHNLFLEDGVGAGTFSDLGVLDAVDGKLRWSADEGDGGSLPLGVDSLADLVDRRIEVRQGSDLILEGVGPDLAASKKPVKHKAKLDDPEAEGDSVVSGQLSIRSKADKGQHRLSIKVKKAPFGTSDIHLFCELAADSGVFVDAGLFDRKGSSSNGRYRRDTHLGAPLPLGVSDLAALSGRELQVRDDADQVLLHVVLPVAP